MYDKQHHAQRGNGTIFVPFTASSSFTMGLKKLILDKEKLTSKRDQLLVVLEKISARLSVLEAQAAESIELESRLHQSEQEVMTLSQKAAILRLQFQEAKHEAASSERLNNFEAALNSKDEEVAAAEERHAWMEEKYKRVTEQNKVYHSTIRDLDVSLQATRSKRNNLSAEVDQLKAELQRRTNSLTIEKSYSMYSMRRKILEEAKMGVINFDVEIAKVRELETTTQKGLPIQPDATDSSGSGFAFSGTEEELEVDGDEGCNDPTSRFEL
ncbi:uncharacterized protein [Nicotiana tomentosiformis]|uniref:uncharacterized protein n=1 Tax=Nicotiana tomentosiformis TaxID=4098 RepID=UPI00388C3484